MAYYIDENGNLKQLLNVTEVVTLAEDIENVSILPTANADTMGKLYRYNNTIYAGVVTNGKHLTAPLISDDLNALPCAYDNEAELIAKLETLTYTGEGTGAYYPLFTVTYGENALTETISIFQEHGDKIYYYIGVYYNETLGEIWGSLSSWINGTLNLASMIAENAGCDESTIFVNEIDDSVKDLFAKYEISEIATKTDINISNNGYELIDEITLEEDVNTMTITQTKNGEALSNFKDFFVMFSGCFASASSGRLRTYSGASMYFCDMGITPTISTNYGWFIEINTIGECYDVPIAADYILRKSNWASGIISGFDVNNSIHAQGISTKTNITNTIQALQKANSSIDTLTVESTLSPFAAGASFKVFGRR